MVTRPVCVLVLISLACFPVNRSFADEIEKLAERLAPLPAKLVSDKKEDGAVLDALFIATVVRLPSAAEKERLGQFLKNTKSRELGCRDILFALVNSKEFLKLNELSVEQSLELTRKMGLIWKKKNK